MGQALQELLTDRALQSPGTAERRPVSNNNSWPDMIRDILYNSRDMGDGVWGVKGDLAKREFFGIPSIATSPQGHLAVNENIVGRQFPFMIEPVRHPSTFSQYGDIELPAGQLVKKKSEGDHK